MVVINIYVIFLSKLPTLDRHALPARGGVSLYQVVRITLGADGAAHIAGGGHRGVASTRGGVLLYQ